ncbi:MAG: MBL fold metallo-hydrolase [Verrucomicrobia bacterium]|nr:MBL fold metallo-hydrolase [Verrucomicrobiota bacterium]
MSHVVLDCFGVGDGWPCADRYHSSFLYRCGAASFLLDCGEGLSRSYKASGLSYDEVDRVFISHLHCDHIGGLFMYLQGLWLEQRRKSLQIHMPLEGIEPVRGLLNAACIFEELHSFPLIYLPLRLGVSVEFEGVRVTPHRSTHLESLRKAFQRRYPQAFESFCFEIECRGRRIVHSADIGGPEDLLPLLEKPVDLLVCELAHFEPLTLFEMLRDKRIGRVVFIHVARPFWERLPEIESAAKRALPGVTIEFARDGSRIELD